MDILQMDEEYADRDLNAYRSGCLISGQNLTSMNSPQGSG